MNNHRAISSISLVSAFLIGVLIFISFGQNWLALDSLPIFLAGLLGVALAVLVFGIMNIRKRSGNKEN